MRAIFTNFGSTGDIQPFIALAQEMKNKGHEPVFAFLPRFAERIKALGFGFWPTGPDLDMEAVVKATMGDWTADQKRNESLQNVATSMESIMEEGLPKLFEDLREACRDADVLIAGTMQPAARMVHELTGIPYVSIQLTHFGGMEADTSDKPMSKLVNAFRARYKLKPLLDPLRLDANSSQLALYAMSRYVRFPDPNWPSHYHITGFFFLEGEEAKPDPELAAFLENGLPPVVFSFGSMIHDNPQAITKILLEAIERVGCRAVIQHGWSGLARDCPLPETVYAAGYLPHDWLFKRAAAVIHHGGAGTTASVWRAGVPAIIVPHAWDQPVWAALCESLGCSPHRQFIQELDVEGLANSLRAVLEQPDYAQNAYLLSRRIRSEGGIVQACGLVENLVNSFTGSAAVPEFKSLAQRAKRTSLLHARRRTRLNTSAEP